jgi:hypothetical protein
MCVVLWLCLIVAPLPPGINTFAVNNNNKYVVHSAFHPETPADTYVDLAVLPILNKEHHFKCIFYISALFELFILIYLLYLLSTTPAIADQ